MTPAVARLRARLSPSLNSTYVARAAVRTGRLESNHDHHNMADESGHPQFPLLATSIRSHSGERALEASEPPRGNACYL